VPRGTPEDLDDRLAQGGRRAGWRTFDLPPGSLFHLPARTPHAVVCRRRSLAVTLTWGSAPRVRDGRRGRGLLRWDVASGFAEPMPPASATFLWTQVPTLAAGLRLMPRLSRAYAHRAGLSRLIDAGILGSRDLPRRIRPDAPAALDGWRFA
jgi:hypothetical protein